MITEINVICQINLLVVISACHGQQFVNVVRPIDRSPMWGCIGPRVAIFDTELLSAFKTFSKLLAEPNIREALEAIGGGMPAENKPFVLWPAEYFFLVAFKGYLELECSDQRLAERAQSIADQLMLSSGGQVVLQREAVQQIQLGLKDHERHFENFRHHFFMVDLYPDNETRFRVRFSLLSETSNDPAANPGVPADN